MISIYSQYGKRIVDIIGAFIGLIISLPIILFFIPLIMIETPGHPIYLQERVGYNGKTFKVIKLRSMITNAEKNGPQWADVNDQRITKIGSLMRRTRVDELPQLINVLKGDMSLVGPRPERPYFTEIFQRALPLFKQRLTVKPGLTGWAQINGGYDLTPPQKLKLDLYYIKHLSFALDIKILCQTIKIIITAKGAR